jgi:hypothetical protein
MGVADPEPEKDFKGAGREKGAVLGPAGKEH